MGVLWYWWAVYEEARQDKMLEALGVSGLAVPEEKLEILRILRKREGISCKPGSGDCRELDCAWREDCCSSVPSLVDIWHGAIAYWSMLAATREMWDGWLGLSEMDAKDVRNALLDGFQSRLKDRGQQHAQMFGGEHPLTLRYRQLDVAFTSEMKAAKAMAGSGYKTKRGRVCAGILMLQRLDLADTVRSQVEELLRKNPQNRELGDLRKILSPYFPIRVLLDNNKPEEALARIRALSLREQRNSEIAQLRAQALLLLGWQQFSVGSLDDALESWGEALDIQVAAETREELQKEVISSCHRRAVALQNRDRDRAIELLEKGLALVKDQKLELELAEALVTRAIEIVNEGQKGLNQKPKAADRRRIVTTFEKAKTDLERALALGSRRAEQNLETLKDLLKALEQGGLLDLPDAVSDLVQEAHEAASKRDDLDTAVAKLEEAYRLTVR
ncbi:MAG TPA: hypothetical protein ENN80_11745, partial [Candidatus Hydrogenedentes bacterium]|nr:hypothetical protein [Candidatus Hydrogenedentota bacterium]